MGFAVESTDGSRRAQILDAAAAVFARSGAATSLRDIADACGILPGSLYHHFDSKEAIVVELVQRYEDEIDQIATRAAAALRSSESQATRELVTMVNERGEVAFRWVKGHSGDEMNDLVDALAVEQSHAVA